SLISSTKLTRPVGAWILCRCIITGVTTLPTRTAQRRRCTIFSRRAMTTSSARSGSPNGTTGRTGPVVPFGDPERALEVVIARLEKIVHLRRCAVRVGRVVTPVIMQRHKIHAPTGRVSFVDEISDPRPTTIPDGRCANAQTGFKNIRRASHRVIHGANWNQ